MQTFEMFVGEFLCIFVFFYYKYFNKEDYGRELKHAEEKQMKTVITFNFKIRK